MVVASSGGERLGPVEVHSGSLDQPGRDLDAIDTGLPNWRPGLIGLRAALSRLLPTWRADSVGRCNSLREYIRRRPVAECLAGPGVEFARNRIQLSLGVAGEVGPLRQILAQ